MLAAAGMSRPKRAVRPQRRPPARGVRDAVLLEAGFKCANPICRHILTLELHHIDWVKDGGGNVPSNLVALCPNCHSLHTAGHISRAAIEAWKSLLLSLNNPHRASADLLLVMYEEEQRVGQSASGESEPPLFRFTGDGLAILAGLLTSGLIEITRRFSGASYFAGGGMPSFEVRLTPAGRRLVAAWRGGTPAAIEEALRTEEP